MVKHYFNINAHKKKQVYKKGSLGGTEDRSFKNIFFFHFKEMFVNIITVIVCKKEDSSRKTNITN